VPLLGVLRQDEVEEGLLAVAVSAPDLGPGVVGPGRAGQGLEGAESWARASE